MTFSVDIGSLTIGQGRALAFIAGPCVIESVENTFRIAEALKGLSDTLNFPLIFKASYDKANRTSIQSFRGPGAREGLDILGQVRRELGIPVLSDVHRISEIDTAAQVLDVIQVPAFLCRQTDFIVEVARTGKPINIKKGQFLAPWDMSNVIGKITAMGNHHILITERGSMFGYNNLVVDFRGIPIMQQTGYPVVFDATHSVQTPGGSGTSSGGQREFAPVLARAAVASGADAVFMEVHFDPDNALCDGPNSLHLHSLGSLLEELMAIRAAISPQHPEGPKAETILP
ncbi:2-Keto-3-deoxy-D-manno-octulosonate-8-phosphate synthase (EC [Olavius algarvensis associated proteobacterium Delta 3]|nr:2-Keto-3-deoxy-D-manno-octulosonate-8-phosphate synthase (EC [Olavius algarvensis associated proteobacterium Delta 3]CAB5119735.1 2-Keto-3-deoxy-D-manno-octulosonate-8-phosphate synthase (EC [Olavius algarvensis associated proteobacterium Delta 3]